MTGAVLPAWLPGGSGRTYASLIQQPSRLEEPNPGDTSARQAEPEGVLTVNAQGAPSKVGEWLSVQKKE